MSRENADCLKPIIGGCGTPPNFTDKTFTDGSQTSKSAKVFSLESFPLYSSTLLLALIFLLMVYTCTYMYIRDGHPPALKNISFLIKPGEKVHRPLHVHDCANVTIVRASKLGTYIVSGFCMVPIGVCLSRHWDVRFEIGKRGTEAFLKFNIHYNLLTYAFCTFALANGLIFTL